MPTCKNEIPIFLNLNFNQDGLFSTIVMRWSMNLVLIIVCLIMLQFDVFPWRTYNSI